MSRPARGRIPTRFSSPPPVPKLRLYPGHPLRTALSLLPSRPLTTRSSRLSPRRARVWTSRLKYLAARAGPGASWRHRTSFPCLETGCQGPLARFCNRGDRGCDILLAPRPFRNGLVPRATGSVTATTAEHRQARLRSSGDQAPDICRAFQRERPGAHGDRFGGHHNCRAPASGPDIVRRSSARHIPGISARHQGSRTRTAHKTALSRWIARQGGSTRDARGRPPAPNHDHEARAADPTSAQPTARGMQGGRPPARKSRIPESLEGVLVGPVAQACGVVAVGRQDRAVGTSLGEEVGLARVHHGIVGDRPTTQPEDV